MIARSRRLFGQNFRTRCSAARMRRRRWATRSERLRVNSSAHDGSGAQSCRRRRARGRLVAAQAHARTHPNCLLPAAFAHDLLSLSRTAAWLERAAFAAVLVAIEAGTVGRP